MHRSFLLVAFAALAAIAQPAHAQFCPGVSPWVFEDVQASDPFCGFITWMAENGITLGCEVVDADHRLYCPAASVSRAAMAAFMKRLGDIRVEAVDTGPGLVGGPITGVGTISLASTQLLPTAPCDPGDVPRWAGSAWTCASAGAGTVTSVASGTGLAGGPITAAGALSIATSYQLPQGCSNGQVAKSNGSGAWTCASDAGGAGTVTSVATGAGLTGGPITGAGTIAADTTYLQRRVSAACAQGAAIRAIGADGSITCQTPANPTELYVPADATPLANGAALAAAVAGITDSAARGYVIRLSRGTYQMASPLQLADGIDLVGRGPSQTTIAGSGLPSVVSIPDAATVELRSLAVSSTSPAASIAILASAGASLTLDDVAVAVESTASGAGFAYVAGVSDANTIGPRLRMYRSSVTAAFTGTGTNVSVTGVSAWNATVRDSTVTASGPAKIGIAFDAGVQASIGDTKLEAAMSGAMGQFAAALRLGGNGSFEVGPVEVHGSSLFARSADTPYAIVIGTMAFDGSFLVADSRLRSFNGPSVYRQGSSGVPLVIVQSQWEGASPGGPPLKCVNNYNWSYVPTATC